LFNEVLHHILQQAELMFDMIREWPRYVNVPFPIAKASVYIDGFPMSK